MTRLAAALAVCLTGAGMVEHAPAVASQPATTPVTIPFELVARHILVKVTIDNSRPLSFVLDTGASAAMVRLAVAKELGLALHGSVESGGAGAGRQAGQRVKNATWSLVGLAGFSQPLTLALPMEQLPRGHGQDVDGIIGGEFLKEFVVELDYQARTIALHDRRSFRYRGKGEKLPLEFNSDGHAVIRAAVTPPGGRPIEHRFHLDTGSGAALILHSPFVGEHKLPGPSSPTIRTIGMTGAGGESLGRTGRVAALQIGSFTLTNPVTIFSQDRAGSFADRSLAGNIGYAIASRFRLTLDYGRREIFLEPSPTFGEPFEPVSSGMAVRAEGADYRSFRVIDVLEDSPATDAGIRKNDVVISIDGIAGEGLTLTILNETLAKPVPHDLTIRRGDETLGVKVTPRPLV